jgi:hypothetical protein
VLATIPQPHVVRKSLEHLGVRAVPLTAAPARDPTWDQTNLAFDADGAEPNDALVAADPRGRTCVRGAAIRAREHRQQDGAASPLGRRLPCGERWPARSPLRFLAPRPELLSVVRLDVAELLGAGRQRVPSTRPTARRRGGLDARSVPAALALQPLAQGIELRDVHLR